MRDGYHKLTDRDRNEYSRAGFDIYGYDNRGYNRYGYDSQGYDRHQRRLTSSEIKNILESLNVKNPIENGTLLIHGKRAINVARTVKTQHSAPGAAP